jgi:hypothetical protein
MQGVLTIMLDVSDPEGHDIIVTLSNAPSYVTSNLNSVIIKPVISTDFGRQSFTINLSDIYGAVQTTTHTIIADIPNGPPFYLYGIPP